MRIVSVGHALFAAIMIALGIMGLVEGKYTPVWTPVPKAISAREVLVYVCALISLVGGTGLLFRRTATIASRLLFASLLVWFLLFRVPNLFLAPTTNDSWFGSGETAVMVAAAWTLYVWFAADWDRRHLRVATGALGQRLARMLYGLALIPFGIGHFNFPKETASLVPAWLPSHLLWVYFTGSAFIGEGIAILLGIFARLAAALSALQIGLFTLLVWVPIIGAGSKDAFQWSETILSLALTTGAWVVADSYRGLPWLSIKSAGQITGATSS